MQRILVPVRGRWRFVDGLGSVPDTNPVTKATPPAAPRDRIEILGLGHGPRGFKALRLNGVDHPDARVLIDLHSPIRVRIGDRTYAEPTVEIVMVSE